MGVSRSALTISHVESILLAQMKLVSSLVDWKSLILSDGFVRRYDDLGKRWAIVRICELLLFFVFISCARKSE